MGKSRVQILGTGCPKCEKLSENVRQAVLQAGLDVEIEKVTDINEILAFGVMMTPAMVFNGEVKIVGKVPSPEDIIPLLS